MVFSWDATLAIAGIALVYSVLSTFINRTLVDQKRVKQIQKDMKELEKEMKEAQNRKDERRLKELMARQGEMMPQIMNMTLMQFKPMLVILPLFYVFVGSGGEMPLIGKGVMLTLFHGYEIAISILGFPLGIPIFHPSNIYGPRGFFVLCTFLLGLLVYQAYELYEKRKNNPEIRK